jgi:hypothetical protein
MVEGLGLVSLAEQHVSVGVNAGILPGCSKRGV